MTITTHRLLYLDSKEPKGTSLENISNLEKHVKKKKKKIIFQP